MRRTRLKILGHPAAYHVMCRITQGQSWLGLAEKVHFCSLLHRVAEYCGIEVITFCVMSNHFHLLIKVPEKAAADAETDGPHLIARVSKLYGNEAGDLLQKLWRAGPTAQSLWQDHRDLHVQRMHDLSIFMSLLKQRFTLWHNQQHRTRGTLWTERFKSLLVETRHGDNNPLAIVAAYIDLQPVRAGIVTAAKDYAFSGYGSARQENSDPHPSLRQFGDKDGAASLWYENLLFGDTRESHIQQPPLPELASILRRRQDSLVKGLVLGSAEFVIGALAFMVDLRRSWRPQAYATGGLGGKLWVGQRHRNR